MPVEFSTHPLPATARAEHWRRAVTETFIPLEVDLHETRPHAGTITSNRLGPLQIALVQAGPQTVARSRRLIARDGQEYVTLTIQHEGTAHLTQGGRDVVLRPGEFTVSDSGHPFRKDLPGAFRFTAFHLPKRELGVRDDDLRALTATVFTQDESTAGLVAAYLRRLARSAGTFEPSVSAHLARSAADLLALLIQERRGQLDPRAPEAASGMLTRIKEYILRRLADPGLSPGQIATAHHVSVRYLHKLFQFEGVTVARWIQRERLRMCRRDLSRRSGASPTVAAVAQRWGFVSPTHFSRVFRAAYGVSPREWQATARS